MGQPTPKHSSRFSKTSRVKKTRHWYPFYWKILPPTETTFRTMAFTQMSQPNLFWPTMFGLIWRQCLMQIKRLQPQDLAEPHSAPPAAFQRQPFGAIRVKPRALQLA